MQDYVENTRQLKPWKMAVMFAVCLVPNVWVCLQIIIGGDFRYVVGPASVGDPKALQAIFVIVLIKLIVSAIGIYMIYAGRRTLGNILFFIVALTSGPIAIVPLLIVAFLWYTDKRAARGRA